jgi:hypothetical protein
VKVVQGEYLEVDDPVAGLTIGEISPGIGRSARALDRDR